MATKQLPKPQKTEKPPMTAAPASPPRVAAPGSSSSNQAMIRLFRMVREDSSARTPGLPAVTPLHQPRMQTKLTINQPGDLYEQEADRVADEVMRMPASSSSPDLQRRCAACEEEEPVRRSAGGEGPSTAPPIVNHVLSQPGRALPDSTRRFFESRMGADFSSVRIHDNAQAAKSADAVQARAYTVGNSIAFATGQYSPQSENGKKLLAHELAHVEQVGAGNRLSRADGTPKCEVNLGTATASGPNPDCVPYSNPFEALQEWGVGKLMVPLLAASTNCGLVGKVWDTYLDKTMTPFSFSEGDCVGRDAKNNSQGLKTAIRNAQGHLGCIIERLPLILRDMPQASTGFELPLHTALGRDPNDPSFHPIIEYGNPAFNAAGQLAGGVGVSGEGSDVFGDDDRLMSGQVVIQVLGSDESSGRIFGLVRLLPHIHVKDTVDFCPGNIGGIFAEELATRRFSKLEATGFAKDVPITIDYDMDPLETTFDVVPLIGPLPKPIPEPNPDPHPVPEPKPVVPGTNCELPTSNLVQGAIHTEVLFAQDSADLSEAQRSRLSDFVQQWSANGTNAPVEIHAFASRDGSLQHNLELSCRRAQSVLAQLSSAVLVQFIPTDKVRLFAHGETSEFGSALGPNRRVVVTSL